MARRVNGVSCPVGWRDLDLRRRRDLAATFSIVSMAEAK
jgi:hypothetical protein